MSEEQKAEEGQKLSVAMALTAGVHHDKLFFRTDLGTAKVEDGRRVELALNADNSILTTIYRTDGTWTTYAIGLSQFVEAALRAEG